MEISTAQTNAYQMAASKGWWDTPRSFGDIIALAHSELSEALEEYRDGHSPSEIRYEGSDEKPEGVPIELADAVIRILDYCGKVGIDLDKAIQIKLHYNMTRPHRHGGKRL